LESGKLFPGGIVTEGSAGSTAISLATVAPAYGCKCHVVIPDDAAIEKVISFKYLDDDSNSLVCIIVHTLKFVSCWTYFSLK
jgi:threonine dehydratase